MLQIPLSDVELSAGRLVEWSLAPPVARRDAAHKVASFNQQKHFAAALAAREEHAPEKNWVGLTFRLAGELDEAAFEAALTRFVRRHEVLRCAFARRGDALECDIIPPDGVVLERVDVGWRDSPDAVRDYLHRRFDETISPLSWPLFLMGVVVGPAESIAYMAFDHIVCDGMSLVMAVNEVQRSYAAARAGTEPELSDVGSYLDFGDAQRDRYAGLTADAPELAFWRRFIDAEGDFFPALPLDFGVGFGRMYPAANETVRLLDDAQATRFEQRCRDRDGKLFMGLLAAVGMALHEVSGVESYRALMPVGERKQAPWREAFGWFVNTMPIDFPVAGRDFDEVLDEVRTSWSELIANIDVPFIKAWEVLAPHYFGLRMWPFPVTFFSFIDYRRLPGAAQADEWRPATIPQASHVNTGNVWFFRNDDGVHVNAIFSDTIEGRRSMGAYRAAMADVLHRLVDPAGATGRAMASSR